MMSPYATLQRQPTLPRRMQNPNEICLAPAFYQLMPKHPALSPTSLRAGPQIPGLHKNQLQNLNLCYLLSSNVSLIIIQYFKRKEASNCKGVKMWGELQYNIVLGKLQHWTTHLTTSTGVKRPFPSSFVWRAQVTFRREWDTFEGSGCI